MLHLCIYLFSRHWIPDCSFCVERLNSGTHLFILFFLHLYRNPLPRSSLTSKEGSLTMPTAPSPPCSGPGGTARGTHLTLRYGAQLTSQTVDL